MFPIEFPGVIGVDVAGTVEALGDGVEGLDVGDRVFGMSQETYAELCVVKAGALAKIPDGLSTVDAAALPLVTATGAQMISLGTKVKAGQTVLITGAVGAVGRAAVFTAKERGAVVIAGVRGSQVKEAQGIGADQVLALDDAAAISALEPVDAVASAVRGDIAETLLARVKSGGVFASVVGPPANAAAHPEVTVVPVQAKPDPALLLHMTAAVLDGRLVIPIGARFPLQEAAAAQEASARSGSGKVLLLAGG
jgi:NADPH:quinone reductase-like Zn-dependent oxidoreductase